MITSHTEIRPKHVLIAGCGYLGRRVAQAWRDAHIDVTVITRSTEKAATLRAEGFAAIVGDLTSGHIADLPEIDTVLWSVGFDRSAGMDRRAIWIDGLIHLLHALPQSVKRFLYVSSTGVYGATNGESVSESTRPNPSTESGQTCLEAEQLLAAFAQERSPSLETVVLRMAGIFGPDRLLRRVTDLRMQTPLPGDPDSLLNLIHADDASMAIRTLAACSSVPSQINVVNTGTLNRQEYYSELARLTHSPTPTFAAEADSVRVRGGNKRVVSDLRDALDLPFRFDDVRAGLADAVERTTTG